MTKRKRGKSKKVRVAGILISQREDELIDRFGNSSFGYNMPCRFCGCSVTDHDDVAAKARGEIFNGAKTAKVPPSASRRRKGFRTDLRNCATKIGFVPSNVREWERRDRQYGENW